MFFLLNSACQFDIRFLSKRGMELSNNSPESNEVFSQNTEPETLDVQYFAKLSSLPIEIDPTGKLSIKISSLSSTHYKYKIGPKSTTQCEHSNQYSKNHIPIDTLISDDLSQYPEGTELILCVKAGVPDVVYQSLNSVSTYKWLKDKPIEVNIKNLGSIFSDTLSNQRIEFEMSEPKPYSTTIHFTVYGTATSMDHTLQSGSLTIPSGETRAGINYSILRNANLNAEKSLNIKIESTSSLGVVPGEFSYQFNSIRDTDGTPNIKISKLSEFNHHICAIKSNTSSGALYCWGLNQYYQLGIGNTTNQSTPILVHSGTQYSSITTKSDTHSCGITDLGYLRCWGLNQYGSLGDGTITQRPLPTPIDGTVTYKQIAISSNFSCGITGNGDLKCWGLNSSYQLGDGTSVNKLTPTLIDAGTKYNFVALGDVHACGITQLGVLKCWGGNLSGQLGDGSVIPKSTPTIIDPGVSYNSLSLSKLTSCGITENHIIKCWGNRSFLAFTDNNCTSLNNFCSSPVIVDGLESYQKISLGSSHACALNILGKIRCWGDNQIGSQLGFKLPSSLSYSFTTPTYVDNENTYSDISSGSYATCGIQSPSGSVKCWGTNSNGLLGRSYSDKNSATPEVVDPGIEYKQVATGSKSTCGLTLSGKIKCWGKEELGSLGLGSTKASLLPKEILTIDSIGKSYLGNGVKADHYCSIRTEDSALQCWGNNSEGQIGDNTLLERPQLSLIDYGTQYQSVHRGSNHTCGLTQSGEVKCWGKNDLGQLGVGFQIINSNTPLSVDLETKYLKLSTGSSNSCGITEAGDLKCWGKNEFFGSLGDGTLVNRDKPVLIDSGVKYNFISNGYMHTCGITQGSKLKCWGNNSNMQVGDNTFMNRLTPTLIDSSENYSFVSSGMSHTCAITSNGVLKCWGDNRNGQIGNGIISTAPSGTPIVVDSGTTYIFVAAGDNYTCGITSQNTLKCWGGNSYSKLGKSYDQRPYWIPAPILNLN